MIDNTQLEAAVLRGLLAVDSPIQGVPIDFRYNPDTKIWTLMCYSKDLMTYKDEDRQAFMRWLWEKAHLAERYQIKAQVVREQ